jgi:hypothetical protein
MIGVMERYMWGEKVEKSEKLWNKKRGFCVERICGVL